MEKGQSVKSLAQNKKRLQQQSFFGGPYRIRTDDLFHAMETRYQLR